MSAQQSHLIEQSMVFFGEQVYAGSHVPDLLAILPLALHGNQISVVPSFLDHLEVFALLYLKSCGHLLILTSDKSQMIVKTCHLMALTLDLTVHLPDLRLIFEKQGPKKVRRKHAHCQQVFVIATILEIVQVNARGSIVLLVSLQLHRELIHDHLK